MELSDIGRKMKVVLVKFIRSSFDNLYSYKTDIDDLKENDYVVVQANDEYSLAKVVRYTNDSNKTEKATKWVVQKIDIEHFKNKLFLGELQ